MLQISRHQLAPLLTLLLRPGVRHVERKMVSTAKLAACLSNISCTIEVAFFCSSLTFESVMGFGLRVCIWVVLGTPLDSTPAGAVLQQLWTKHSRLW